MRFPASPEPARAGKWSGSRLVRLSIGLHAVAAAGALASPACWPWLLGAVAADHAVLGGLGMWPRSRLLGPNLLRLPPASARRGEVALSFDDGPDPRVTPGALDLLDRTGARATFFCIGHRAAAHPALLREIAARGHEIGNHSDTHPAAFAAYSPAALRRELGDAQARIADITGAPPRHFRAPMGLRSPLLDPVLHALDLRLVTWTRRGCDTVRRNPVAVLAVLARGLGGGDILALHDGNAALAASGGPVVLEVLPALLDRLAAVRLRSVRLSDAVGEGAPGSVIDRPAIGGPAIRAQPMCGLGGRDAPVSEAG